MLFKIWHEQTNTIAQMRARAITDTVSDIWTPARHPRGTDLRCSDCRRLAATTREHYYRTEVRLRGRART
jgi:hypothetical protein